MSCASCFTDVHRDGFDKGWGHQPRGVADAVPAESGCGGGWQRAAWNVRARCRYCRRGRHCCCRRRLAPPPTCPPTHPPTPCRHHIFHDAAGADRGAPAAPQPFMKHTSSLLASREPACRPAGVCLPRCLACCAACQGAYTALQRPPTGPRCSAGVPAVPHATQICPRAAAAAAITSAAVPPLDPASSPALD